MKRISAANFTSARAFVVSTVPLSTAGHGKAELLGHGYVGAEQWAARGRAVPPAASWPAEQGAAGRGAEGAKGVLGGWMRQTPCTLQVLGRMLNFSGLWGGEGELAV